jgi:hypothetical protein
MKDSVKVVAVRDYGIVMPNGVVAMLSVAMCDPDDDDSVPARFAQMQGAHAYGLITVQGIEGAPSAPMIWVAISERIAVTIGEGEPDLTPALREVIQRYLEEYFKDIADLVPELGDFGSRPRALN